MSRYLSALGCIAFFMVLAAGCEEDTTTTPSPKFSQAIDTSFAVGDSVTLMVDSFAGRITVREGQAGTIEVRATKWASRVGDLALIAIGMTEQPGTLQIQATQPAGVNNVSLDLEITVPSDTELQLATGVGTIDCRGRPRGSCRYATGVGSVVLRLPADVNLTVELATGVGRIHVDFLVNGVVSEHSVNGAIGNGNEGEVHARTGVGNIDLIRL
ncbi:MAG: hypothetical protein OEN01_01045 [Candidatus Krumholzibacteria bacterium]|nr:hypothetical protein [Candidatus Krumholzibacteria bacterium]